MFTVHIILIHCLTVRVHRKSTVRYIHSIVKTNLVKRLKNIIVDNSGVHVQKSNVNTKESNLQWNVSEKKDMVHIELYRSV